MSEQILKVLLGAEGQVVLAPLYDVASAFPYQRPRECMKMAMSIGGENRIGKVGSHHIQRFVEANALEEVGFPVDACAGIMARLAEAVPSRLADVLEDIRDRAGINEIQSRLIDPISELCKVTLARL